MRNFVSGANAANEALKKKKWFWISGFGKDLFSLCLQNASGPVRGQTYSPQPRFYKANSASNPQILQNSRGLARGQTFFTPFALSENENATKLYEIKPHAIGTTENVFAASRNQQRTCKAFNNVSRAILKQA